MTSQPIRMHSTGVPVFDDDLQPAAFDRFIEGAADLRTEWRAALVTAEAASKAHTLAERTAREASPEVEYATREEWLHAAARTAAPLAAEVTRCNREAVRLLTAIDALTRRHAATSRAAARTALVEADADCRKAHAALSEALTRREDLARVAGVRTDGYRGHSRLGNVVGFDSQMAEIKVICDLALRRSPEVDAERAEREARVRSMMKAVNR